MAWKNLNQPRLISAPTASWWGNPATSADFAHYPRQESACGFILPTVYLFLWTQAYCVGKQYSRMEQTLGVRRASLIRTATIRRPPARDNTLDHIERNSPELNKVQETLPKYGAGAKTAHGTVTALLFNPVVRVWFIRFHAVWAAALFYGWLGALGWAPSVAVGYGFQIALLFIIFWHHAAFGIWPSDVKGMAVVELGLIFLEMAGVSYLIYMYQSATLSDTSNAPYIFPPKFSIAVLSVELADLGILVLFRIATIAKSREKVLHQGLEPLGACTLEPQRELEIVPARYPVRPLVRGESGVIIWARSQIIFYIGLGLPIFALYRIVFMPATTQNYSKHISPFQLNTDGIVGFPPGNASLLLSHLDRSAFGDPATYNIQTLIWTREDHLDCETTSSLQVNSGIVIQCPYSWYQITNVSISLSLPPGITGVYVVPIQGVLFGPQKKDILGQWLTGFSHKLDGAPLFGGSDLAATFTWTQTNVILNERWCLLSPPTMAVYTPDISGLQPYRGGGSSQPNSATLTLIQRESLSTRLFIDTPDSTVLNGISTLGGFWTFLNGAFTLIFGANLLYFVFGRRSLSALGLVHIFQRRKLKRQWHKDFPALHTEGGQPGSESAGIIAFLRERLVDVGDPDESDDLEAQRNSDAEHPNEVTHVGSVPIPNSPTRDSGSEDIPLLDADLGLPGSMTGPKNRDLFAEWLANFGTTLDDIGDPPTINGFQPLPGGCQSTRLFIETAEETVLNGGIATFGGFWTFFNGRRPLSALGLVHIFQRRRLKHQWNMDFHAVRSEGGLPGSESAGIAAFIRERLVDLGEDSHPAAADKPDDVKAQRNLGKEDIDETNTFESLPAAKFKYRELSEPGYILDKIPLLDIDLGSSGSRRAIHDKKHIYRRIYRPTD
ncbi:hypothetical protein C8F04DRAFT_1300507 [Mycena alexandri]|uniref:Uncharacterized protein n=1 Tax=Mycena alexandri TaxID=1745969 RepID=A0AAD6WUA8_9AGAR|nr:hypothetical protein C8F04DRAFT_1300507 [Mycena alexandri]